MEKLIQIMTECGAGTAAAISEPVPKNSENRTEIANNPVKIQLITIAHHPFDVQYADNKNSCLCKNDKKSSILK